jgi:S1-C subfamily serine protease
MCRTTARPRALPSLRRAHALALFASLTLVSTSLPACLAQPARAADAAPNTLQSATLQSTIRQVQRKIVKIYGAGGLRGLEAYQSGILISPEGHILTALSYVLDADDLRVVLDDGAHYTATLVGSDPVAELAVLKLPLEEGDTVPAFDLAAAGAAAIGDRVLALSNLYNIAGGDEPVSVLQGVVAAIAPLEARRGGFQSNYHGPVYVLDAAANNPGAAGGALVDWNGRLLGVLGKELKNRATGAWLHYALPIGEIAATVERLRAGESLAGANDLPPPVDGLALADLGLVLVPDILARTPPYIDTVFADSPAARAGLRPDDLVVFVAGEAVSSCKSVAETVGRHEKFDEVQLAVLRDGKFIEVALLADDGFAEEEPAEDDFDEERLEEEPATDEPADVESAESEDADEFPTTDELADELPTNSESGDE